MKKIIGLFTIVVMLLSFVPATLAVEIYGYDENGKPLDYLGDVIVAPWEDGIGEMPFDASASGNCISVAWNEKYFYNQETFSPLPMELYRKSPKDTEWKLIYETRGSGEYLDKDIDTPGEYKYLARLKGRNDGIESRSVFVGIFVDYSPVEISVLNRKNYNVISLYNTGVMSPDLYNTEIIYRAYNHKTKTWSKWKFVTKTATQFQTNHRVLSGYIYQYATRNCAKKSESQIKNSSYIFSNTIAVLDAPTVKATPTQNGAKVTWNKVAGANGYRVYYKKAGAKSWTLVSKTAALSYSRNLPKGEIGQFAVYAVYNYSDGRYDKSTLATSGYVKSYASVKK